MTQASIGRQYDLQTFLPCSFNNNENEKLIKTQGKTYFFGMAIILHCRHKFKRKRLVLIKDKLEDMDVSLIKEGVRLVAIIFRTCLQPNRWTYITSLGPK